MPSRVVTCNRIPCSGTTTNVPRCLPASRKISFGAAQAFAAFMPAPVSEIANSCRPSVRPRRCSVMIRSLSVFNSVQWLSALPVMDSTSIPVGSAKLRRKIPARVMSTVAFTASTARSSPSESVSCDSTRTSGSTSEAFSTAVAFTSA